MMSDVATDLRTRYASLIGALMAVGESGHARECAELAVRHGIWKHPLQRPTNFDPALPQTPVYSAERFWFCEYLESHSATIREEVLRVVERSHDGFSPVDEPLVASGRWTEAVFYENGLRMDRPCQLFPKTAEIVSGIADAIHSGGVVMLSWLAPGTHIVPHCGASNRRLRVHMGIQVPDGASMRVGDERIVWREGKCVVFDDSFEHEVWNTSASARIILLLDIPHPNLPEEPRASASAPADLDDVIRQFLTDHGIAGVERDVATDELTVVPDEPTARVIGRYMKDLSVTRVQMTRGTLVVD